MKVNPRCFSFAMFVSISVFLVIQFCIYDWWYQCRNHPDEKFVSLRTREDDFNSTNPRKRAPVSGEELLRMFEGVRTFVMFIGHPRSVSSLTASLLDAHPEVIISRELHFYDRWYDKKLVTQTKIIKKYALFYEIYASSQERALFSGRSPSVKSGKEVEYAYYVSGQWQGTYKNKIKVIGDKDAGATSYNPFYKLLPFFKELEEVTGTTIRLIHLVRNPFDNIATLVLRELRKREVVRHTSKKVNNSKVLDHTISMYFHLSFTNKHILEQCGDIVLTLGSYEITQRPRETLQRLCDHLMVTCYQDYVEACKKILYNSPSVTRNSIVWTDEQKERVLREMKKYPYLQNFNFEDTP